MSVKQAMHPLTKVPSHISVTEAARIMDQKIVGSVLVEENAKIIGIVTERDILRKSVAMGKNGDQVRIKEIMSYPIVTVDAYATLEEASDLIKRHNVRRLVVMENGQMVGLISARNIAEGLRYFIANKLQDYQRMSFGK